MADDAENGADLRADRLSRWRNSLPPGTFTAVAFSRGLHALLCVDLDFNLHCLARTTRGFREPRIYEGAAEHRAPVIMRNGKQKRVVVITGASSGIGAACTIATGSLARSFLESVKVSIPALHIENSDGPPREYSYLATTPPSGTRKVYPRLRLSGPGLSDIGGLHHCARLS